MFKAKKTFVAPTAKFYIMLLKNKSYYLENKIL